MSDNKGKPKGEENLAHKDKTNHKHSYLVVEDGNTVKSERQVDSIPVYYQPKPLKKKKNNWLTPILITIASAGVIGTVLGMLLLQLFVGMESEQAQEVSDPNPVNSAATPPVEAGSKEQLPNLSAYVLQAGVFQEQGNADEWKSLYEGNGEPAFIWERDGQYFLFIGVFATEEGARKKVKELQENGNDVFFKSWETTNVEIDLSAEALQWLEQFQDIWVKAVDAKDQNELLALSDNAPSVSSIENVVQILKEDNDNIDVLLLELMYAYENL